MATYKSVVTTLGQQKISDAIANDTAIDIVRFSVGDGNGSEVTPATNMTNLVHSVYEATINGKFVVDTRVIIEAIIPADNGGFYVREMGIFDSDGTMIAIANVPETYKPTLAEGTASDLVLRMVIQVTSPDVINITVDTSAMLITAQGLEDVLNNISVIDGGILN